MENFPTYALVVAAAIRDGEGRWLLQQVLPHKRHAGQWEFPGGKVEDSETPRFALCREVAEELGIALAEDALKPAGFAEEQAADGRTGLVLLLYTCESWSGDPQGREGQRWAWFSPAEAAELPMPAMDCSLLARLQAHSPV